MTLTLQPSDPSTYRTGSRSAVWTPTTTTVYRNFDDLRAAVRSITPDNAQLIAMAKRLKPDLSWYPVQESQH